MTEIMQITENLEPFIGPIEGEILFDRIEEELRKFLILPDGGYEAITLWLAGTYCLNNFRIYPKLFVYSPTKRCGKTTLLEITSAFAQKSLPVSNVTPATIFRVIQLEQPSLLIDEADTYLKQKTGDMVAIINSGHTQKLAYVMRCEGKDNIPTRFSTWSPMVIASIGKVTSTILDRSVRVPLRRATNKEKQGIPRVPYNYDDQMKPYRQQLKKWTTAIKGAMQSNLVLPPDIGSSRAQDNWECLFTIASLVSSKWLQKCEDAYQKLEKSSFSGSVQDDLLKDIYTIFQKWKHRNITSEALVNALIVNKDSQWVECSNHKPITQRKLADLLKEFGISPGPIRQGKNANKRGYTISDFDDAFKRYL